MGSWLACTNGNPTWPTHSMRMHAIHQMQDPNKWHISFSHLLWVTVLLLKSWKDRMTKWAHQHLPLLSKRCFTIFPKDQFQTHPTLPSSLAHFPPAAPRFNSHDKSGSMGLYYDVTKTSFASGDRHNFHPALVEVFQCYSARTTDELFLPLGRHFYDLISGLQGLRPVKAAKLLYQINYKKHSKPQRLQNFSTRFCCLTHHGLELKYHRLACLIYQYYLWLLTQYDF